MWRCKWWPDPRHVRGVGWHARFLRENVLAPFAEAFEATATADLARIRGADDPDLWRVAVSMWDEETYGGAKARWRLAMSLSAIGPANPEVGGLLDDAKEVAVRLGAHPLMREIMRLRAIADAVPRSGAGPDRASTS